MSTASGTATSAPGRRSRPPLRSIEERNALIEPNTRLVWAVIRRYFPALPVRDHDDAYQAGLLGLLRAAELFDPAKGFAFSTYACRWVWQAIGRHLFGDDLIRLPCHIRGDR